MLDQARLFGRQGLFVRAERLPRVRVSIKFKSEFAHGFLLELLFGLERFPFERNRSNDKKSLKIKTLEQALIEKVYQLFRSLL